MDDLKKINFHFPIINTQKLAIIRSENHRLKIVYYLRFKIFKNSYNILIFIGLKITPRNEPLWQIPAFFFHCEKIYSMSEIY